MRPPRSRRWRLADGREAVCVFTDRSDGDLRVTNDPDVLAARRSRIVDRPWTWLEQVHGSSVVEVGSAGEGAGRQADASVTCASGAVLAVHTADCAPVMLAADEGVVGAAHAGWRGAVDGVVGETVAAMRDAGASSFHAVVGPCIEPERYEFGADDLEVLADRFGDEVRATTIDGRLALDLRAVVRVTLGRAGVDDVTFHPGATASDVGAYWSHRARGDRARQASVIWITESS